MFYLIDMYNGYKFIGKFKTYEELEMAISKVKSKGKKSCLHLYSEKCREKLLVTWV